MQDLFRHAGAITPPANAAERLDWLRLIRSRKVGPATFYRLMQEHGSAAAALEALPAIAREASVKDYAVYPVDLAEQELRRGQRIGAKLIARGERYYPALLNDLDDPPPLIWALGDLTLMGRPAVAMVGARNASSLGLRMAGALARDLGQAGQVIVSGLARGIDTAAHTAALDTGTIAVMAGGVDVIYPPENAELADNIAAGGLRISEQPMGLSPTARHFPRRNRLISGLARAVVVVEAAARSGSLITARDALDQGREVLAVPGHPFDARSAGANMLIRDGATLVRSAKDVLEVLETPVSHQQMAEAPYSAILVPPAPPEKHSLRETAKLHQIILDRLGPSPLAEDQLIRDLGRAPADVTGELLSLELDGRVLRAPGGLLSRTP